MGYAVLNNNSILKELVMTHGGQRAKEEYKKLVEENEELKQEKDSLVNTLRDIITSDTVIEQLQSDKSRLIEILKEMACCTTVRYVMGDLRHRAIELIKEMEV